MTTTEHNPPLELEHLHDDADILLGALGQHIGDADGIQQIISDTVDTYPDHWPLIFTAALGWTFLRHVQLAPEHVNYWENTQ